jgi:hypothetical protein
MVSMSYVIHDVITYKLKSLYHTLGSLERIFPLLLLSVSRTKGLYSTLRILKVETHIKTKVVLILR